MAQGGFWDVEGTGLSKIQDLTLAESLLRKTNIMNLEIAKKAVATTLVLGLLPEVFTLLNRGM